MRPLRAKARSAAKGGCKHETQTACTRIIRGGWDVSRTYFFHKRWLARTFGEFCLRGAVLLIIDAPSARGSELLPFSFDVALSNGDVPDCPA